MPPGLLSSLFEFLPRSSALARLPRPTSRPRGIVHALLGIWLVLGMAPGCGRKHELKQHAQPSLLVEIPHQVAKETRLTLGDPLVQKALELSGAIDQLPFTASFQNLTGGPQTLEAFRAGALDAGSVGDTPPIHAAFTGLSVKIIAVLTRDRPTFELAIAPGSRISKIEELRGKRIAYAPGQAQGALILRVLKKAGIAQREVKFVELNSAEFKDALASRQVDVAPLSGTILLRYLKENRLQGAASIAHGVRDSLSFLYVRTAVLENPANAAALREYVKIRTKMQLWIAAHPVQWLEAYYIKDQGLTAEEGRYLIELSSQPRYPRDWAETIALTQGTIDLLAEASGRPRFEAADVFDLRFQQVGADAADAVERRASAGRD